MLIELLLLILFLLCVWDFKNCLQIQKQIKSIPIISKLPIIGSFFGTTSFRHDNLYLKFHEFITRYGKTFAARSCGYTVVITADPCNIESLLSSQRHLRKYILYNLLTSWLGKGLLLNKGQDWQRMRKIITPTFHFKILERFVEIFEKQSTIFIEKLAHFADGKSVVNIYPYVGLMTLDIITESAMGVSINAQARNESNVVNAFQSVTEILSTRFMKPYLAVLLAFRILTPGLYKKQMASIKTLHEFTVEIIRDRRAALQTRTSNLTVNSTNEDIGLKSSNALLDVLLQATVDDEPLTDNQIRDEVNTFIFEGHDTTTSAISFCLYLLSRHPECQQKVFEELRSHFGDDLSRPITYHDLLELTYLSCVIKESLRLYPPVPAIGRWLEEDLKLEDATLPAGCNVLVLIWELLRDPEFFSDPERFWPERHLENDNRSHAFIYLPFSAGPRNCIGQRFAMFEMKTVIIKMLRHYELIEAGEDVHPSIQVVLKSKTGINFSIKNRKY